MLRVSPYRVLTMRGYGDRVMGLFINALNLLCKREFASVMRFLAVLVAGLAGLSAASAQTVTTVVNSTTGAINGSTTCAAPLVRNFSVASSFTVADVDLGVFATHSWRGDIRITLQAPDGTRVQLVNGNADTVSGDHFNVRLDDGGTQQVNTDSATGNHSTTTPPPFQNRFSPDSALSAFNGKAAAGTWRMEICDIFSGADDGEFRYAALYLTSAPAAFADLSLTKSVSNAGPVMGANVIYTLVVTNSSASNRTASGVQVTDLLPAGTSYVSHSGPGSYAPGTGIWQVGSLAPGASATLAITAQVTASSGATVLNVAEVSASSQFDSDSTPGNGLTTEDDYAQASLTVTGARVAGTPPSFTCPVGSLLFDWSPLTWTAGSTNNSYALGTMGQIGFALNNPGSWLNNAGLGGQSPNLQTAVTGGLAVVDRSLIQLVDLANRTDVVTTTITLPRSVMGARFTVFDLDFGASQFADRIVVTGRFRGATVLPVLTNGVANYVIGNTAFGDAASDNTSGNGNVVVTFQQPVDTIIIQYGNHAAAPANPGQQAISIHDISLCRPTTTIGATKVSSIVADPLNGTTSPKAIPGALVDYVITLTNSGQVEVDGGSVQIVDAVPPDTKFCLADMAPGAGPVLFTDGSPSSGLSYSFASLGSATDNLSFSANGGTSYAHVPVPDADGCDPAITHFRVVPTGAFAPGSSITLRARFRIR